MKQIITIGILLFCTGRSLAQNSSATIRNAISSSSDGLWDLNKFVWSHTHSVGQQPGKQVIDFDAMDNWDGLLGGKDVAISRNGQYFAYGTKKGTSDKLDSLIVQSTIHNRRQAIMGANPGFFSGDNKQYIYQENGGLCFWLLDSDIRRYIENITSYKIPYNGLNEWIAYQLKSKELILQNLMTGKEKRFDSVVTYNFDKNNRWLILQLNNAYKELVIYDLIAEKECHFMNVTGYLYNENNNIWVLKTMEKRNNGTVLALKVVDLKEYVNIDQASFIKTIWSASDTLLNITSYDMDATGKQVVFMLQDLGKKLYTNSVWFWRNEMDKAELKIDNLFNKAYQNFLIQGPVSFATNAKYIIFSLQPKPDSREPRPDEAQITVWSFQDTTLQSSQRIIKTRSIAAILDCENGTLIRLKELENMIGIIGNNAIVYKNSKQENGDRFWKRDYNMDSCWQISLENGNRKYIARGNILNFSISPDASYLVFYNCDRQGNYFSYDLRNERLVNLSSGISAWQFRLFADPELRSGGVHYAAGLAGWLKNKTEVLVYDNFDIWLLDMSGKSLPVNITNGYGRKHNILFSLMTTDRMSNGIPVLNNYDTLILRAFDKQKKYNGFYRKILKLKGNPELLYMGPYFFEAQTGIESKNKGMNPIKAADKDTWIVMRQTTTEAPNYFLTENFKKFVPLTNYQPQKTYNWLFAELHHFKRLDGTVGQGVLYKPTNFNPTQKYPVIVSFYGDLSDLLYQYPSPKYINAPHIFHNPAWMVSHGYLVFVPDIMFSKSKWGPNTVNTIDGVARYLSHLPFVDGKRLGACGHSNSGRFGYYLLTHSNSFAAISAGSGFCGADVISGALSLSNNGGSSGSSNLETVEVSAFGTGLGNLWKNKASWVDHSAVLQADRIKSPFLLFHGRKDGDDVRLAIELFTALYRLEKTAWWLEYDNGGHTVIGTDAKDFTIRFTQFFDHYLKRAPAPKWMTSGLPYKLKGIENRYELDADGFCAKECSICISQKHP